MRPQSCQGSWRPRLPGMSSVANSSANRAPQSYMPVPHLEMAGDTVRITGATEEMDNGEMVGNGEMTTCTIFGRDTITY